MRKVAVGDARVRRPRAAAQDAVAVAEEDLGVLAVGVGDEAGVAAELATTSTPTPGRRPRGPCEPSVRWFQVAAFSHSASVGRRAPCAAGEGVGLEPGDVAHGRVGVPRGHAAVVRDVVVLLPRPALVRPPLAAHVAAALGEVQPRGVRDRAAGDAEGGDVDRVRAGARCRRRSARRAAPMRERAGRGRRPSRRAPSPAAGRGAGSPSGSSAAEVHRLAHRLGVLELVAERPSRGSPGRAARRRAPRACARARRRGSARRRPRRAARSRRARRAASRRRRRARRGRGAAAARPPWRCTSQRSS